MITFSEALNICGWDITEDEDGDWMVEYSMAKYYDIDSTTLSSVPKSKLSKQEQYALGKFYMGWIDRLGDECEDDLTYLELAAYHFKKYIVSQIEEGSVNAMCETKVISKDKCHAAALMGAFVTKDDSGKCRIEAEDIKKLFHVKPNGNLMLVNFFNISISTLLTYNQNHDSYIQDEWDAAGGEAGILRK